MQTILKVVNDSSEYGLLSTSDCDLRTTNPATCVDFCINNLCTHLGKNRPGFIALAKLLLRYATPLFNY